MRPGVGGPRRTRTTAGTLRRRASPAVARAASSHGEHAHRSLWSSTGDAEGLRRDLRMADGRSHVGTHDDVVEIYQWYAKSDLEVERLS